MLKSINSEALLFSDNRKIAVFEERKSKYKANNTNNTLIQGYRIDGALIKNDNKCDFCLAIPDRKAIYLIELKGKNLPHACKQINKTIDFLKSYNINPIINARIVLTKVSAPDLETNEYKQLSRRLRCLGGNLKKESLQMTENI